MTLPASLVVGRLQLRDGQREDDPLTVSVFEPRALFRRHDPGVLFTLIDFLADTPSDDELLGELMAVVQETYEQERGSITRRLRQAVGAANRHLRSWNRERQNGRQAAGLTCAALVEDEVYLAQAGPALAFVAQPGAVERFPAESPWLTEEPLDTMPRGIWTPLGLRDDVYVDLNFTQVGPGYALMLISAHLLQILPEDELALLLDQDPEDVLRDLGAIASGQDLSALVAGLLEPEPAEEAPAAGPAAPSGPGLGRRMAAAAQRGAVAVGSAGAAVLGGTANVLEGMLPERVGEEDEEPSERRRLAYMWLALLIPVALALFTLAMYWTRNDSREIQSLDLVQTASAQVAEARSLAESDPGRARELLLEASQTLNQVLGQQPSDPVAGELLAEAQSQLERIAGVERLSDVISIAALPGRFEDRRRLVIQGTSAYVLNHREQVIRRVGLGDRRITEVLRADSTHAGQSVGPLVDMTWVPAGGVREQGAVVALDSTGTAWEIDAFGNVTPLKVAAADEWQGLRLIGGFAGNLYVLDIGQGQILKYSPTVDGYAVPPVAWLLPEVSINLNNVVDMAIDGAIYLLRPSGRVEKLVAGEPVPFDQPDEFDLSQPVACFARPPADSVFLADTARVLQFDGAGAFQRQLLPSQGQWERLSALWVDEFNGWLYAVDAGDLVMARLPAQ